MDKIMKKHTPKNPYLSKWTDNILHIYDFIYRQNYYFIPAQSRDEFRSICKKELKIDIESNGNDCEKSGGFKVIEKVHKCYRCKKHITDTTQIALIWASTPKDVVHESFHAVSWALRTRGLSLTNESDEAFAYALTFLVEQILKAIE